MGGVGSLTVEFVETALRDLDEDCQCKFNLSRQQCGIRVLQLCGREMMWPLGQMCGILGVYATAWAA